MYQLNYLHYFCPRAASGSVILSTATVVTRTVGPSGARARRPTRLGDQQWIRAERHAPLLSKGGDRHRPPTSTWFAYQLTARSREYG